MRAASHRKMEMKIAVAVGVTAIFALTAQSALASNDLTGDCRIGTYHLQDGTDVDIGATEGPHLRWRRRDGTTGELTKESDGSWTSTLGWTQRPDGKRVSFSDCARGDGEGSTELTEPERKSWRLAPRKPSLMIL